MTSEIPVVFIFYLIILREVGEVVYSQAENKTNISTNSTVLIVNCCFCCRHEVAFVLGQVASPAAVKVRYLHYQHDLFNSLSWS